MVVRSVRKRVAVAGILHALLDRPLRPWQWGYCLASALATCQCSRHCLCFGRRQQGLRHLRWHGEAPARRSCVAGGRSSRTAGPIWLHRANRGARRPIRFARCDSRRPSRRVSRARYEAWRDVRGAADHDQDLPVLRGSAVDVAGGRQVAAGAGASGSNFDMIKVGSSERAVTQNNERKPADIMAGQYSLPFCTALALQGDPEDPRLFSTEALSNPGIRALMEKVTMYVDDKMHAAYPQSMGARVSAVMLGKGEVVAEILRRARHGSCAVFAGRARGEIQAPCRLGNRKRRGGASARCHRRA